MVSFEASIRRIVDRMLKEERAAALKSLKAELDGHRTPRHYRRRQKAAPAVVTISAPPKKKRTGTRGQQLQGKYMSAVRHLGPAEKATVKGIRVSRGVLAAIRAAKKLQGMTA